MIQGLMEVIIDFGFGISEFGFLGRTFEGRITNYPIRRAPFRQASFDKLRTSQGLRQGTPSVEF